MLQSYPIMYSGTPQANPPIALYIHQPTSHPQAISRSLLESYSAAQPTMGQITQHMNSYPHPTALGVNTIATPSSNGFDQRNSLLNGIAVVAPTVSSEFPTVSHVNHVVNLTISNSSNSSHNSKHPASKTTAATNNVNPYRFSPTGSRQKFTPEEDNLLYELVKQYGTSNWKAVMRHMKGRSARQCRERFKYYLEPTLNKNEWTESEDRILMVKHAELGPKWSQITQYLKSRTPIDLKNRFHLLQRACEKKGHSAPSDEISPKILNSSKTNIASNKTILKSPSVSDIGNSLNSIQHRNMALPSITNFLEISPNPTQFVNLQSQQS
ncbi:hypothetical protein TRFO_15051 [Tritrichomonas foetus]|uniref:Myb-like DNA-binding domain containing protein n=1 Tax=Tritrichomonas foetus TaxID=1144522 RepID=A0A1J4KTF3_9EUKA|nr:hypothetical protein TRFO_15051 [Tritrichomonas foetus]|eukprot:OHT14531.1 hypothetical protein TRFO_15051 [Tritrichomonas foetus]